ncbi:uncharacterized protein LOC101895837 [Musca domestica]|uniref:Uncharacterized protein LOC101895837 n=1 Tax=Musca domestica TaxID=7370 RepID=A0A1I8MR13_MUSDO|nr:uncharacterized protein LOC101895837 [Musca domestica]
MNTLTKQNLIIGLSALSFCVAIVLKEFENRKILKESSFNHNTPNDDDDDQVALKIAICSGAIIVCLLQIWGTLRHPLALIPFIPCIIWAIGYTVLNNTFNFMWMRYDHFPFILSNVLVVGMEVLALYTTCSFVRHLWNEKKKKSVEKQNPNYYDKV